MKQNVPIIGIHSKARSGKDTIANFILALRGGYIYSFADPIRAMIAAIGIDMRDPYWQEHKEDLIPALGVSPRRLMQTLGTEWGRNLINPNIWIIMATQNLLRFGNGMIIPDVRFENEADWVRSNGGVLIHVERPNAPKIEAHDSEKGVEFRADLGDLKIVNSGTLEDLHEKVRRLFDAD